MASMGDRGVSSKATAVSVSPTDVPFLKMIQDNVDKHDNEHKRLRNGYDHVLLMTTGDIFHGCPRPKPYFCIVTADDLIDLCGVAARAIYPCEDVNEIGWHPELTDDMRRSHLTVDEDLELLPEEVATVKVFCLIDLRKSMIIAQK